MFLSPIFSIAIILLYSRRVFTAPVTGGASSCSPDTFTFPELDEAAELIGITAAEVHNHTVYSWIPGSPRTPLGVINTCNVSVTYMHTGWNDPITVSILLPLQGWNGRLRAAGGGGYATGRGFQEIDEYVIDGYVAISTDGGHAAGEASYYSLEWALPNKGNVNLYLLQDYATRAHGDLPIIGRSICTEYYGRAPEFSYLTGSSAGGRQGLMVAQRYPDRYDGIIAAAPALNIHRAAPAGSWSHHVMFTLDYFPSACEVDGFTLAAIDACDELDGVKDGYIGAPELCHFSGQDVVSQNVSCGEVDIQLTEAGAKIVDAAWNGPVDPSGTIGWFGVAKDSNISSNLAATTCADGNCSARLTSDLYSNWVKNLLAKDADFDFASMTTEEFFSYLQLSSREYDSMMSGTNPDLSAFRARGGKILSWHGLADGALPYGGPRAYYEEVLRLDPNVAEFYRFYELPGPTHGPGGDPVHAMDQLIAWVEQGVAPEPFIATYPDGSTKPSCIYPSKLTYVVGDPKDYQSFTCTPVPFDSEKILAVTAAFYRGT